MNEHQCPRCGATDCLTQKPRLFTVPVELAGFEAHAWVMCLALREPVLIGHHFPVRGWLAAFRAYWRSLFMLSAARVVDSAQPWALSYLDVVPTTLDTASSTYRVTLDASRMVKS